MSDKIKVNEVFEGVLEGVSQAFAMPRSKARQEKSCVMCGGKAEVFNSALSEKEYTLS